MRTYFFCLWRRHNASRNRSSSLAVLVSSSPYWTYLTTFWFLENTIACVRGCVTTSNLINLINHALTVITQQVQSLRSKTKLTLTNLATLVNHFNTCFIKLNLKRHRNLLNIDVPETFHWFTKPLSFGVMILGVSQIKLLLKCKTIVLLNCIKSSVHRNITYQAWGHVGDDLNQPLYNVYGCVKNLK